MEKKNIIEFADLYTRVGNFGVLFLHENTVNYGIAFFWGGRHGHAHFHEHACTAHTHTHTVPVTLSPPMTSLVCLSLRPCPHHSLIQPSISDSPSTHPHPQPQPHLAHQLYNRGVFADTTGGAQGRHGLLPPLPAAAVQSIPGPTTEGGHTHRGPSGESWPLLFIAPEGRPGPAVRRGDF